jgi:hypothetical protein
MSKVADKSERKSKLDLRDMTPVLVPIRKDYHLTIIKVPDAIYSMVQESVKDFDWSTVTHDTVLPFLHVDPAQRYYIAELEDYITGGQLAMAIVKALKKLALEAGQDVSLLGKEEMGQLAIFHCGVTPENHKLTGRVHKDEMYRFVNTVTVGRW